MLGMRGDARSRQSQSPRRGAGGYEPEPRTQIEYFVLKRGEVPRETTRELEGDLTRGSGPTHLLSSPSTAEVLKNVGEIAISPVSPPGIKPVLKFEYSRFRHPVLNSAWAMGGPRLAPSTQPRRGNNDKHMGWGSPALRPTLYHLISGVHGSLLRQRGRVGGPL